MHPPLTDFFALMVIDLALCAVCLWVVRLGRGRGRYASPVPRWVMILFFAGWWLPTGSAGLPVVAYVRGISADLSITMLVVACLSLRQRLAGSVVIEKRESEAVLFTVAAAAIFLYPLALGIGNWDPYRLGWGTLGMWSACLVSGLIFWVFQFRLLAVTLSLALLAWTAGLMESTNFWDYLIDPWLSVWALGCVFLKWARRLLGASQ